MAANPTAAETSHTDGNQQFSLVAVQGTLGTADVSGSARTVPLGADPVTGALFVNNLGAGGSGGTNVNIVSGTINNIIYGTVVPDKSSITNSYAVAAAFSGVVIRNGGLVTNIRGTWVGTISFTASTDGITYFPMNVINVTNGNIVGSTTGNGIFSFPAGYYSAGGSMTSYTSGTAFLDNFTTLSSQLTSLFNPLPTGTNTIGTVGISGTQTIQGRHINNNATDPGQDLAVLAAEARANAPSLTEQRIQFLSMDLSGNLRTTLASKPTQNILTYGTSGTSVIGTLVAAGGTGTSIYVTSYSIDGDSTTLGTAEVILSFGTQVTGTAVLFRATLNTLNEVASMNYGAFPVGGGITNLPLTYLIQTGAGSVSWNITYFVQ